MIENDSIYFDTIFSSIENTKEEIPVLIGDETKEEINFPFSENLIRDLQPDWIFYFAIGAITLFAWIKLVYSQLTNDIIVSAVNYQLSLRLFKNANIGQKRISLVYSVFYFFSFGVYLYLIFKYFNYSPAGLHYLQLIFAIIVFILAVFLLRNLTFRIVGEVFRKEKLFEEAAFHNSLYNKLIGISVLPFILIISYISQPYLEIMVYLSLFVLAAVTFLRLFRAINFVIKNVISYFYFILYLCALEIIPILVLIKVIDSL